MRTLDVVRAGSRPDVSTSAVGDLPSDRVGEPSTAQLDIWKHFEDGYLMSSPGESQAADARTRGGAQFLLVDRSAKRYFTRSVSTSGGLCTVLLPYYLTVSLPRRNALELGREADALQALVAGLLDPFGRDAIPSGRSRARRSIETCCPGSWSILHSRREARKPRISHAGRAPRITSTVAKRDRTLTGVTTGT